MVKRNREALLKKYLVNESKDVDIEDSRDGHLLMPNKKPPNTCTPMKCENTARSTCNKNVFYNDNSSSGYNEYG
jgi:hypothetical protein